MSIKSINPTTEKVLKEYDYISFEELENKIQTANKSFKKWKQISFQERKKYMKNLSEVMSQKKEELAKLDTLEMWMPFEAAKKDVEKAISNIDYFWENAEILLQEETFDQDWTKGKIIYQPLWVIFSIMPWNFPYNQVLRSAIQNIMAWNTVIMKHASNVPQIAEKIQEIFEQAEFPQGIYTNLFIPHNFTEEIIKHPYIEGCNVTWWETIWKSVGKIAWESLKPSILELGGNDPFIVLDSKDIQKVAKEAAWWRLSNWWQKCNSSKRFIVLESMYKEFKEHFVKEFENIKVGDPFEENTKIWPLAKESLLKEIDQQVKDSINQWAKILTWWEKLWEKGYFYKPTILDNVNPWMKVFDEEVFGPVAPITVAKDIDEAINLANNSRYWLGCSVYGNNQEQLQYVANKIESGNVFLNKVVTSYAFLPYWWIKDSWYGKELWKEGIRAFTNQKVIVEN